MKKGPGKGLLRRGDGKEKKKGPSGAPLPAKNIKKTSPHKGKQGGIFGTNCAANRDVPARKEGKNTAKTVGVRKMKRPKRQGNE